MAERCNHSVDNGVVDQRARGILDQDQVGCQWGEGLQTRKHRALTACCPDMRRRQPFMLQPQCRIARAMVRMDYGHHERDVRPPEEGLDRPGQHRLSRQHPVLLRPAANALADAGRDHDDSDCFLGSQAPCSKGNALV